MNSESYQRGTMEVTPGHEGRFSSELGLGVWRTPEETVKTDSGDSKSRQSLGEIKRKGKSGGIGGR